MTPAERAAEPLAGALFACQPAVRGIAEPRFRLDARSTDTKTLA
jgi:hypothetical protein